MKLSHRNGFTLLEIVVSIAVVSVVVLSAATIFVMYFRTEYLTIKQDNALREINNIHTIFTSDPETFKQTMEMIYGEAYDSSTNIVMYNDFFEPDPIGVFQIEITLRETMFEDYILYDIDLEVGSTLSFDQDLLYRALKVRKDSP